jgi:hypothetical protein
MTVSPPLFIHHVTSHPRQFFGRTAELAVLDAALADDAASVVALVGPGGQGKTAILQHWLGMLAVGGTPLDGIFLWSFYRGKDGDVCLRQLYAAVAGVAGAGDVSASWCADHLVTLLRQRRWVVLLDGTEVVQYDSGSWTGRFLHPELGRLLEQLASAPQPGVTLVTSRFPLPDLDRRPCARAISLSALDVSSARRLLAMLGVRGSDPELDDAARWAGMHAKAVELLGTYLVHYHEGKAAGFRSLSEPCRMKGASDEEHHVTRVAAAYQAALPRETRDVLALTTAFRDPPPESRLLDYLASSSVRTLLHDTWQRDYSPFTDRELGWIAAQIEMLVRLRLLERVCRMPSGSPEREADVVIDAHPLVRRSFDEVLGATGREQSAGARAGFLRGRPDRKQAASLVEAREETELFHAWCDAGLWPEADAALAALDKPRYRFLAPAFERDLLLRFFPSGDWRQPPLWSGFRRQRDLAICLEMLGQFAEAVEAYPADDAPLRGDALIALGQLGPLLENDRPPHPWQMLWQAYRALALCLAGQVDEAVALARRLVPGDVYEWSHVFECLLRAGRLDAVDMNSFLYRSPREGESRWNELGRRRMRADYLRLAVPNADPEPDYTAALDGYDRGGLPYERALTRLGFCRWLLDRGDATAARAMNAVTLDLARRHRMTLIEKDAWSLEIAAATRAGERADQSNWEVRRLSAANLYHGPARP